MEQSDNQRARIEEAVNNAIEQLYEKDAYLLKRDVNERSISHKLACYLQQKLEHEGWDVDCEYNRHRDDPKRLNLSHLHPRSIDIEDIQATTVYPDIIVHKRGTRENLLVIEMKKNSTEQGRARDYEKLRAFKRELGYQHTLFLDISTERKPPFLDWDCERE